MNLYVKKERVFELIYEILGITCFFQITYYHMGLHQYPCTIWDNTIHHIFMKRKVKAVAMQAPITMSTICQSSKDYSCYWCSISLHLGAVFSLTDILFSFIPMVVISSTECLCPVLLFYTDGIWGTSGCSFFFMSSLNGWFPST